MSDWQVHLEFADDGSNKFWRARVEGGTLYVNYGKIGTTGQTQVKELGPDGAKKEFDKLVREKRKKGYADAGADGGAAAADGEEDDDDDDEDEAPPPPKKKAAAAAPAPAAKAPEVKEEKKEDSAKLGGAIRSNFAKSLFGSVMKKNK